jgi:hypothetical protein
MATAWKGRMLVVGRNHSSEPRALRIDRIAHPVIREALARAKSLGSALYLVAVGFTAIWVIGVFFGVGLLSLMYPRTPKDASEFGVGSAHLSASLVENPWLLSVTKADELSLEPSAGALGDWSQVIAVPDQKNEHGVFQDPRLAARANPLADQNTAKPEGRPRAPESGPAPSVPDEQLLGFPARIQPAEAIGPRAAAPPQRSRQLRSASGGKAPVQAIQDLLQKQPRLLK